MTWQPIETAPIENQHYPFSDFRAIVFCGYVGEAEFHGHPGEQWSGWWWANTDSQYGSEIFPTHWMPLPAPPETDK